MWIAWLESNPHPSLPGPVWNAVIEGIRSLLSGMEQPIASAVHAMCLYGWIWVNIFTFLASRKYASLTVWHFEIEVRRFTQDFVLVLILSLFMCELDLVQLRFGFEGQRMVERGSRSQLNAYQHHYEAWCISAQFQRCSLFFPLLLQLSKKRTHKRMWRAWPHP